MDALADTIQRRWYRVRTMNITEDVKRLSDIQRMIGQISGKSEEDWIDDFCAMIGDYITELFLAKTDLAIVRDVERREP